MAKQGGEFPCAPAFHVLAFVCGGFKPTEQFCDFFGFHVPFPSFDIAKIVHSFILTKERNKHFLPPRHFSLGEGDEKAPTTEAGAGAPQPSGGLRSISAITGRGLLYGVSRAAYAVGEVAERAL